MLKTCKIKNNSLTKQKHLDTYYLQLTLFFGSVPRKLVNMIFIYSSNWVQSIFIRMSGITSNMNVIVSSL